MPNPPRPVYKPSMVRNRETLHKGLPSDPAQSVTLPDAVAHLTRVAQIAYAETGPYARKPLGQGVLGIENDKIFGGIISLVYRFQPSLQQLWQAYRVDYERVTVAVAKKAQEWVPKALGANRETLGRFEEAVFLPENLTRLHQAAGRFRNAVWNQRERYTLYEIGPRGPDRRIENSVARRQVEREALDEVGDRFLRILFGHPDRRSLFPDLAEGEQQAREALAELFRESHEAISKFGRELEGDSERFWRYPPIVLGAFGALSVPAEPVFARYLLDIARLRALDWWDLPLSVAGTALTGVALVVTGGWGAVALGLIDLGISGFSAYQAFLAARENELAGRAGAFGQVFTDQPISYGDAALEAVAAIITGVEIVPVTRKLLREAGEAKKAAEAAKVLPPGTRLGDRATLQTASADTGLGFDRRGLLEPTSPPGPASRGVENSSIESNGLPGPPPVGNPPPSPRGGGGGPGRPGHRGTTAEGFGESFQYEFHPEVKSPNVEQGLRPESRGLPLSRSNKVTPEPAEGWPNLEEDVPPPEAELIQGPLKQGIRGQWLHPQVSLPESIEAARQAGVPQVVFGDGWVMTRADFPDVVPDRPVPLGRPAPAREATLGRRVSSSDIQNGEVRSDLRLTQDALEGSGAHIVDVRVDQTQISTSGGRAGTNRPDLQLTILEAELSGRRIHIEYDRFPGTRALDHARRILTNDPDAIVILKLIDFEPPRRRQRR